MRRCSGYGSGGALLVTAASIAQQPIFATRLIRFSMPTSLRIQTFRSIRDAAVKLGQVNLFMGPNNLG